MAQFIMSRLNFMKDRAEVIVGVDIVQLILSNQFDIKSRANALYYVHVFARLYNWTLRNSNNMCFNLINISLATQYVHV